MYGTITHFSVMFLPNVYPVICVCLCVSLCVGVLTCVCVHKMTSCLHIYTSTEHMHTCTLSPSSEADNEPSWMPTLFWCAAVTDKPSAFSSTICMR